MGRKNRTVKQTPVSKVVTKELKIVAFICNWVNKGKKKPVDLSSKSYSTDIKFFRVMCASRIDRAMLLKCVQEKVDGIFIGICNNDNCQYRDAIELAEKRFESTIDFLDHLGYDKDRIYVYEDDGKPMNSLPKILDYFTQKVKQLEKYQ